MFLIARLIRLARRQPVAAPVHTTDWTNGRGHAATYYGNSANAHRSHIQVKFK